MQSFGGAGVGRGHVPPSSVNLAKTITAITTPEVGAGNVAKALEVSNQIGEALRRTTLGMESMNQAFARTSAALAAPSKLNLAKTITAMTTPQVQATNALGISGHIGAELRSAAGLDQATGNALRPLTEVQREVKTDPSLGVIPEGLRQPPELRLPPIPPMPERPEVDLLRQIREQAAPKPAGRARLAVAAVTVLVAAGGIAAEALLLSPGAAVAAALAVVYGEVGALSALFKNADFRAGVRQLLRRR